MRHWPGFIPVGAAALLVAALANRLQTSMNLALGSGLATIGLTIPSLAMALVPLGRPHPPDAGRDPPGALRDLPLPLARALAAAP